ncbi:MAG: hypothetical protein AAF290_12635 [Pseudomonadota bacterium]
MSKNIVFDYRALRLLVGLIAFAIPFAVSLIARESLTSISASYHTDARDAFVGLLFIVGAFLWAYNGHNIRQGRASKVASLAAFLVALYPTACDACEPDIVSIVHVSAAAVLFTILAYFCLGPFREHIRNAGGKAGRRDNIYLACGVVMVASMIAIGIGNLPPVKEFATGIRLTYWGEAAALCAFGVAWITAGKVIPWLADDKEALHLFARKGG